MNIKDFLIDNYIWILVVILLSIITIIGFLADKKKGKKEKPIKTKENQTANQDAVNPISYQAPPTNTMYQPPLGAINTQINNPNPTTVNTSFPNTMNNQGVNQPTIEPIAPVSPINSINNNYNSLNNNSFGPSIEQPGTIPKAVSPQPIITNQIPNTNPIPSPLENINSMNNITNTTLPTPEQPQTISVPNQVTPQQNIAFNPYQNTNNNNQFPNQTLPPQQEYPQMANFNQPTTPINSVYPNETVIPNIQTPPSPQNNLQNSGMSSPQVTSPQPINFVYGNPSNDQQQ